MTIGIYLLIILILGYTSVYIRERWLDLKWMKPITWLGIFIHESAHAFFCLLTGGRITGFRVTASEGSVTHYKPKVPIIGPLFTAMGPLIFGILIIGAIDYFIMQGTWQTGSTDIAENFRQIVYHLNFLEWRTWLLLVLFLNIGVMVGPSLADLKNIWLLVIISFFIRSQALAEIMALIIALIVINILLFLLLWILKLILTKRKRLSGRVA